MRFVTIALPPTAEGASVFPNWALAVICALLLLAPVSTKLAGLLFFVILGMSVWIVLRWSPAEAGLARQWLIIAAAALILRAAATLTWSDSWGSRHFEGRFFLMALAAWVILRRSALSAAQQVWLTSCLALACWVAFWVVWVLGRDTPTNPVPWAAGVAFMVCVLGGRLIESNEPTTIRVAYLFGSVAGVAAVLLTQSRGSYGLLLWVSFLLLVGLRRLSARHGRAFCWRTLAVMTGLMVLAALLQPRLVHDPLLRLQQAAEEAGTLFQAIRQEQITSAAVDTSVGARLYMWVRVVDELGEHGLTGVGQSERQAWVKRLGESSGSQVIQALDHIHSDPLNIWFEHGLLGLSSYLFVFFGMICLAWRARAHSLGLALGLGGLAFMHFSSGLSNVNTLHNFYGVMLSLCTFFALWLAPASGSSKRFQGHT
jgi:O-antigen ligase